MTFRIAVVQPITNPIGEDEKNIADAAGFIARAKAESPTSSASRKPIPARGACRQRSIRRRPELRETMYPRPPQAMG